MKNPMAADVRALQVFVAIRKAKRENADLLAHIADLPLYSRRARIKREEDARSEPLSRAMSEPVTFTARMGLPREHPDRLDG